MMRRAWKRAIGAGAGLAVSVAMGCGGDGGNGASDSADRACPQPDTAPTGLRRLTRAEYNNTVRDLLGDDSRPADDFVADDASEGFAANAVVPVTRLGVEQYMGAAEQLAATAATDLSALVPCDPAVDGASACARTFIADFGKRAYRRPLDPLEIEALASTYERRAAGSDFSAGIQVVIQTILQSPHFLYRVELGSPPTDGETVVPLTDYEIASRLSYSLWASMPDDELFAAADTGQLADTQVLAEHANRMLDDPKASDAYLSFYGQWLGLSDFANTRKDPTRFPEFTAELRDSMFVETMVFADHVMREGDHRLETLLTAPFSFLDAPLQQLYGVAGPTIGPGAFVLTPLPAGQRSGILTHASVMAAFADADQTSPVLRGKFIRNRLLCASPPPPPPDIDVTPPPVDPSLPTKQRWGQHRSNPACAGCHQLLDPVGIGFEHYDTIGRWTDVDGNYAVDATGDVIGTLDLDGPFDGAVELGQRLAASEQVQQCVVRQWFRFALGRAASDHDACSLAFVDQEFSDSDSDLRELLVAIVTSDAFRYWRLPQ